ncbi:uncharacterized protein PITG_01776 [Phytophthora infestans T30-4]|uniref:Uncharacterized protein n=1 Tax=Phytophthora infestans (strain T30-4) TaxID=403677 RepID=D0MU23_PHYIT|nr:uncharacterized protein PITG_01776 [Phytophthora infestans T30-4]EEY61470.1 hypothetical protein PITG_01776 [Phytophthora infestans T30-4]|eukprot:XP_002908387.1 hypothetical protein PITG_01776 [Phytophthora infestans T30-4]
MGAVAAELEGKLAVQELLGYALSCAAVHNQTEIMELLLYPSNKTGSKSKYFPRRQRFQCCYALRYLAYAAVVCVEQNALQALEFLIGQQIPPPLLVDTDVVRCFRVALELGSDLNAPEPEAHRPMLMALLHRYPALLLAHVDGTHDVDVSLDNNTRNHIEALRSSLLYEYVTNPQLHK